MPTISTRHGKLFYDIQGEGEPIVMIKGMSLSSRHWIGFDKKMAKHHKVITFDNRGVGRSNSKLNWNFSMKLLAEDVCQILDAAKVGSAHLLGFSLGGMISLTTATIFPERVRSIALVNSSIGGMLTPRLSPRAVYTSLRYGLNKQRLVTELARVLVYKGTKDLNKEKIADAFLSIHDKEGFPTLATAFQIWAAARFCATEQIKKLGTPTLIVYGANDVFVPPINSLMLHKLIPNAKLVKLDEAGHELMLDEPDALIAEYEAFLKSLGK